VLLDEDRVKILGRKLAGMNMTKSCGLGNPLKKAKKFDPK